MHVPFNFLCIATTVVTAITRSLNGVIDTVMGAAFMVVNSVRAIRKKNDKSHRQNYRSLVMQYSRSAAPIGSHLSRSAVRSKIFVVRAIIRLVGHHMLVLVRYEGGNCHVLTATQSVLR